MADVKRCPQCGAELPADAPDQPCPACLIKLGLASWVAQSAAATPDQQPTTPWPGRFDPPPAETLQRWFRNLEIIDFVGSGGMGAVYKARQPHLDRLVALKILPPQLAEDPAFEERFTREARALARLSHPNVVAVFDFGVVSATAEEGETEGRRQGETGAGGEGGTEGRREGETEGRGEGGPLYYFLMEYVDGANLRELIRQRKLQPEEALAIVPQICAALQFAHDEGIVHRDIKPENILIDKRGRVKIADFGLAKIVQPLSAGDKTEEVRGTLTGTGQVMGTLHYMAPEQLQGSRAVDHRADIYSLGVVFYEMLTGELPIGKFEPPSHKVHIDVRLDEVVLRALEADPERRYQMAGDVKTDVESIRSAVRPIVEAELRQAIGPFQRPHGLRRYAFGLAMSVLIVWTICRGLLLEVSPVTYLGAVAGVPLLILLGWVVSAVPYSNGSAKVIPTRRMAHLFAGGAQLLLGLAPWLNDPAFWSITGHMPGAHDRQVAFVLSAAMECLTLMFLVANWYPYQWLRGRRAQRQDSLFRQLTRHPAGRLVLLLLAMLAGYLGYKLFLPDISDAMWAVVMVVTLLGFLVDVLGHPGRVTGLRAAFPLLAGLTAVVIYLIADPRPLLNWLYHVGGISPGQDDPTFLRIVLAFIVAWLIWQLVQVGRRIGRPATQGVIFGAFVVTAMVLAVGGKLISSRRAPALSQSKLATVQEIAASELERRTPGLSVFRYELKLPPGHYAEFATELWRHGRLEKSGIQLGGVLRDGRVELRLQEGETLSPQGQGQLRWDWRVDAFGGATTQTGGWIEDPFAGMKGRSSSWRGAEEWQLTPGPQHAVLLLRGWEDAKVPGVPDAYARNPTVLARAIDRGEIPRADVELHLTVRVRR